MKKEKYVCLAGVYDFKKDVMGNNRVPKIAKYYWTFDRIKTKKDCDSYFARQCTKS